MPCYRLNQFLVESDLPLACPPAAVSDGEPLTARYSSGTLGEFPCVRWLGRRHGGEFLRAYNVGIDVLICAGDKVKMLAEKEGSGLVLDFDSTDAFATALAVALTINLGLSLSTLMRGDLPLHGAAVELDGQLIGLLAPSGTGKSTLLWKLLDAGARFAADDVLPVRIENGGVTAYPSVSLPSKLSRKALEARGEEPERYAEVLPGEDEFWIPMAPECRLLEPRPLAALFLLQPFRSPEPPGQILVRRLADASAYYLLLSHTQGLWAAYDRLDARRLFSQVAALLRSVPLYTLGYPRHREVLPDLMRVIHQLLTTGRLAA